MDEIANSVEAVDWAGGKVKAHTRSTVKHHALTELRVIAQFPTPTHKTRARCVA